MAKIICIGGALIDETFQCIGGAMQGTSNPASFRRTPGGVSQNIAHHLSLLGNEVELISHFGNDIDGRWLINECTRAGIGVEHSVRDDNETGRYVAIVEPDGNLFAGAAAMSIEKIITSGYLAAKSELLRSAVFIQADCNLSSETLEWLCDFARKENKPLAIDPVSVSKAVKLNSVNLKMVELITPNMDELHALSENQNNADALIKTLLNRGVKNVWIKNGKSGSVIYSNQATIRNAARDITVEDVTGAGDAALAGWIHYFVRGKSTEECMKAGRAMAELVLQAKGSILHSLDSVMLEEKFLSIT